MGDQGLRQRERLASALGSTEDESAWLKERLRSGSLTREQLELAAFCGDLAAGHLAPDSFRPGPPGTEIGIREWAEELEAWGPEVLIRAASASLRMANDYWLEVSPEDTRLADALLCAERWALGSQVFQATRELAARAATEAYYDYDLFDLQHLAWAAVLLARVPDDLEEACSLACDAADDALIGVPERIAEELIAWALSSTDMMRARLEANEEALLPISDEAPA